jgi:small subunit ribosomal protein S9
MTGTWLSHSLRRVAASSSSRTICFSNTQSCRSFSSTQPPNSDFRELKLQPEGSDFTAAPEIDFGDVNDHEVPLLNRIRVVPDSPAYFSARPEFTDDYLRVEALYYKWKSLPRCEVPPLVYWQSFNETKANSGNEPVMKPRYSAMKRMLESMQAIEPVLMPAEVQKVLNAHKRAVQPGDIKPKVYDVDDWGRSLGVGKRKESTAKAYLALGDGQVLINGRSLTQVFGRVHDRESALWPLKISDRVDKYNVFGLVSGGGVTGQAEALMLAVAKALVVQEPILEARLLEGTCNPLLSSVYGC